MPFHRVLGAIDAIYETPGRPGHWSVALQHIADVFDAAGAVLIAQAEDGTLSTVVSPALVDAQRDYQDGWWKQDFLTARVLEKRYVVPGNVIHEWDMATAEEIARGVVFLSSPASSFTTGTNLVIDGALTKGVQL